MTLGGMDTGKLEVTPSNIAGNIWISGGAGRVVWLELPY